MKAILVTGGAGYIGAHACKALAAAGFLPIAYDDLSAGLEKAVRWGPLEKGGIADSNRLDEVIARHRPVAVMHFAGSCYVGESVADPGKYYRNNVAGSLALFEAMIRNGIGKVVFSSSAAIYGIPESVPIREDAPRRPINPYGRTKWIVELMLRDFSVSHGMEWAALRYFNAAGADPDGETGESHDPETHLVPLALKAVAGTGAPLAVFGDDYETPDGTCIRDYVHVSDLASAHVLALKALLAGEPGGAFNLGIGQGHSVRQVIESVARVTGREVPVTVGQRRPGDPAVLVADASRARQELGWNPALSALENIVATAWRWERGR